MNSPPRPGIVYHDTIAQYADHEVIRRSTIFGITDGSA